MKHRKGIKLPHFIYDVEEPIILSDRIIITFKTVEGFLRWACGCVVYRVKREEGYMFFCYDSMGGFAMFHSEKGELS